MKLRHYYLSLLTVVGTMFLLSGFWEFVLEDIVGSTLHPATFEPETIAQRVEFVLTVTVFSMIALIVPAILGRRAIQEQERAHEVARRNAESDYLTGLSNRRKATEALQEEVKRANRYKTIFSIILLDVDHFKLTNDTHGHTVGDEVLVTMGAILKQSTRSADVLARWGGEEFLILCPETELSGASQLAEKIRERIASTHFGRAGKKTASFGVASFYPGEDSESLIQRVDSALYDAKESGRNRVKRVA